MEDIFAIVVLSSVKIPCNKKRDGRLINKEIQKIADICEQKYGNEVFILRLKKFLCEKMKYYDRISILNSKYLGDWKNEIKDSNIKKLIKL